MSLRRIYTSPSRTYWRHTRSTPRSALDQRRSIDCGRYEIATEVTAVSMTTGGRGEPGHPVLLLFRRRAALLCRRRRDFHFATAWRLFRSLDHFVKNALRVLIHVARRFLLRCHVTPGCGRSTLPAGRLTPLRSA